MNNYGSCDISSNVYVVNCITFCKSFLLFAQKENITSRRPFSFHNAKTIPYVLLCGNCTALKECPYMHIFSLAQSFHLLFIRPSSDGLYYGMVMSVRPSIRPSVRVFVWVSVRQSQFSALCSFMLWRIEMKFGMSLSSYEHLIKFECRQFPSSFVGVMPLLELRIMEIHSFPQFSPTCFDTLSWKFAYDFILLYYTSSLSVINLRQFL